MVRVKICCMASAEEVAQAIEGGASAVGFVSEMPTGPGVVDDALIRSLAARTPPGVSRFLLTSRLDGKGIADHVLRTGVDVVQICDHVPAATRLEIRSACSVRIVQVVHVVDEGSVAFAAEASEGSDALLLDSGQPGADFKELGGTGRTHDWGLSARIVERSPIPVWLAGGLNAGNVAESIRRVKPFGVDLCTGVRTDGRLDVGKLKAFMGAVHAAERC